MKYFKHLSAFLVLGLLVFGSMTAFSAIITTWNFSNPADYNVSDEDDVEIAGNQLLIDNIKEFQINDNVVGGQAIPIVDSMNDGNYVIVWESNDTVSTADTSEAFVGLKIIDSNGDEVISEIVVNDNYVGKQFVADVEVLSNDNIIVVWQSQDTTFGTDNSQALISAKIIDTAGTTVVPEFQVNDEITGIQGSPSVSELANGNIVITWSSADTVLDPSVGNDNSGGYVAAKIIDNTGATVVSEFQVNDEIENIQAGSDVRGLSNGNFVVSWYSNDLNNPFTDNSQSYVAAKLFDSAGDVVLPEFQVNDEIENGQWNMDVLQLSSGQVVISWESDDNSNPFTDNDGDYIAAKVYDENLVELVSETQINQEIEGDQRFAILAELANGDVFVTWSSLDTNHSGDDDQFYHVAGIVLDDTLNVVKDEFQVNDAIGTFQVQSYPAVSTTTGNLLVAYSNYDFTYADTDNDSIYISGKIYQPNVEEFYPDTSPFVSLGTGVAYDEALRTFTVDLDDDSEGSISLQISNNDGVNWYYYDGNSWVETVDGVLESNTITEVNDNLFEFFDTYGEGVFNWKIFLNSDGTELVIVDNVSLSENEIPVIGNGDANVSIDVPQNREAVGRFEASDPEDDDVEFSISGGADSGLFSITSDGLLSISLDGDLGETYEVIVRSTDEFDGFTEQTVDVTVVRVPPSNGSGGASTSSPFATQDNEASDGEVEGELNEFEAEDVVIPNKDKVRTTTDRGEFCVNDLEMGRTFDPTNVTRIEAVAMFVDFMCADIEEYEVELPFLDIGLMTDEELKYLRAGYGLGIIKGYPDGYFRPNKNLNYVEFSALMYRSVERDILDSNPWYADYIKVTNVVQEDRLDQEINGEELYMRLKEFYGF